MWASTYARLPAASHPNIAATAGHLAARMPHSAYPVVLDTLLDGIAAEPATAPQLRPGRSRLP
ncbi:hypothetical protein ACWEN4_17405 [Streptomyces violaceorubidus]